MRSLLADDKGRDAAEKKTRGGRRLRHLPKGLSARRSPSASVAVFGRGADADARRVAKAIARSPYVLTQLAAASSWSVSLTSREEKVFSIMPTGRR